MMRAFAVIFLAALATGAKLDNTYLPPSNAPTAGGSGGFLQTPFQSNQFGDKYSQQPDNFGKFNSHSIGQFAKSQQQFGAGLPFSQAYTSQPQVGYGSIPQVGYSQPQLHGGFGSPVQQGYASQPQTQGRYASQVNAGQSYSQSPRHGYQGPPSNILRFNNQNYGDGTYQYEFEADNSISQQEVGHVKQGSTAVQGGYSYVAPDGQTVSVNYVADENGFQPTGSHIKVPSLNSHNAQYNSYGTPVSSNGHSNSKPGFGGNFNGAYEKNGRVQNSEYGQDPYQTHQLNRQYLPPSTGASGYSY